MDVFRVQSKEGIGRLAAKPDRRDGKGLRVHV